MNKSYEIPMITGLIENCPKTIEEQFDQIFSEIKEAYAVRFKSNEALVEYMEYSRGWHYLIFQKFLECKCAPGSRVLDVGSLFGATSIFMAKNGMEVTALDGYVDELADDLKLKYGITFIFANLENKMLPPLKDGYFDLVIMSEILEHLNYNPVPALLMIRKSMLAGGKLIITTPDDSVYSPVPSSPVARYCHHLEIPVWNEGSHRQSFPHSKQYRLDEFQEILANCGFRVETIMRYEYQGIHMLAVARPKKDWQPNEKVLDVMRKMYPNFDFFSIDDRIQKLNSEITFMKSSKFWKLRDRYVAGKNFIAKLFK